LATLDRFVAVEGAISVDLRGQVTAETIGGRQVSGAGQSAFMAVASQAPDGRAVIAMTARADGTWKLVPTLDREVVTTPLHFVDAVVREFGRARPGDRSTGDRAAALAAVAHPDDRSAPRPESSGEPAPGRLLTVSGGQDLIHHHPPFCAWRPSAAE
jgi:acyl-CoA hydrolase